MKRRFVSPTMWRAAGKDVGPVLLCLALVACSSDHGNGDLASPGHVQTGKASYYAKRFQSRKTASGELYDRAKLTAAHRTLPFGTEVRVTNLANAKSVIVEVNDRGPFAKRRVIDLSRAAFASIAALDAGVIDVRLEVIE
ncbi:MAG: septal ring lytic transglycosylase RlpA family protein [Gammaproteobacteria bacterium]|nr:septal ring lytic transglycosylase RlpA family protein [Gammaproteobacteria bacterium]